MRKICPRCGKEITQGHPLHCLDPYKVSNKKLAVPTYFEGRKFCRVLSDDTANFAIFLGNQPDTRINDFRKNLDEAISCLQKDRRNLNRCYP